MNHALRRAALALALSASLAASSGCATIMSGGQSRLQVNVEGPETGMTTTVRGVNNDEEVTRQDQHFDVVLDRQSSYVVVASAQGYQHGIRVVRSETNPWLWGNFGLMAAGLIYVLATPIPPRETPYGGIDRGGLNLEPFFYSYIAGMMGFLIDHASAAAWRHNAQAVEVRLEKRE